MSEEQPAYLANGSLLDYEELQATAKALLDESDLSQKEMAERLDVSRGAVAKALTTEPGSRYAKTQRDIIEELGGADRVHEEVRFRVVNREDTDA